MCNKWTYFVLPYTILANVDTDCGEFEKVANVGGKDCMTMYENTICTLGKTMGKTYTKCHGH